MATKLKCVFKRVNGNNTGCHARTKPTKNSASVGILYMRNCPDGKTFYCDSSAGVGNYKKLLEPAKYGLPNAEIYVYVSTPHILSQELIDEPDPKPPVGRSGPISGNKIQKRIPNPYPPSARGTGAKKPNPPKPETAAKGIDASAPNASSAQDSDQFQLSDVPDMDSQYVVRRWKALERWNPEWEHYGIDDYLSDYEFLTEPKGYNNPITILYRNNNIFHGNELMNKTLWGDLVTRFNRFNLDFPNTKIDMTHGHVFFTRPDLNLMESMDKLTSEASKLGDVYHIFKSDPDLVRSLSNNYFNGDHKFLPLLSNAVRNFELSDESIDDLDVGETIAGHKIKYGKHSIKSRAAGTISFKFSEDNQMRILKLLKLWVNYIHRVYRGELSPKTAYIKQGILDYAVSAYYFLTAPDNETILLWSKYTGLLPLNIPYSNLGWDYGSPVTNPSYSVSFAYAWKEEFNPFHLVEFNNLGGDKPTRYISNYEAPLGKTGKTFMAAPFVDVVQDSGSLSKYTFKLRFRPKTATNAMYGGVSDRYSENYDKYASSIGRQKDRTDELKVLDTNDILNSANDWFQQQRTNVKKSKGMDILSNSEIPSPYENDGITKKDWSTLPKSKRANSESPTGINKNVRDPRTPVIPAYSNKDLNVDSSLKSSLTPNNPDNIYDYHF